MSAPRATVVPRGSRWRTALIALGICAAVALAFERVRGFEFVRYDDPDYVDAPAVRGGLSWDGLTWALTTGDASNWIPLARASYMLDRELFGAASGAHHLTSVAVHALAALVLFAFLERATGALWRSAIVAALFAVHPLRVESVAWVAERKDVLCGLFWFATLAGYARYAERPSAARYALVLACFALAALSKPMVVTLPFQLVLLDFWPLRRLPFAPRGADGAPPRFAPVSWGRALAEKLPFAALSVAVAAIAFAVQSRSGAVESLGAHSLATRFGNALVAYAAYARDLAWPARLAVLYPYPAQVDARAVVASGASIAAVTAAVVWRARRAPHFFVGWFWYLGTLVPVIGLVQVGYQSRADRYTYVPTVGLSIAVVWGATELVQRRAALRRLACAAAGLCVAACVAATRAQTRFWADSEALFSRAIAVTESNHVMHDNLGSVLVEDPARVLQALREHDTALEIEPGFAMAHLNRGVALSRLPGRMSEAIAEWETAVRLAPRLAKAHANLGAALAADPTRAEEGRVHLETALAIAPDDPLAHSNLGVVLARDPARRDEGLAHLRRAIELAPQRADSHARYGATLLAQRERLPDAIAALETAVRLDPSFSAAHNDLGVALAQTPNRMPDAVQAFEAALRADPDNADAHGNLGLALSKLPGRESEAIRHLEASLAARADPRLRQALDRLRAR